MCSKVDLWVKTNQLRILEQFMKKSFLRLNGNFAFDRNHLKQHCCYCYCSSNECICLFIYFHIFKRNDRSRFLENTSERFPAAFKCLSTYLSLSLSLTHTHTSRNTSEGGTKELREGILHHGIASHWLKKLGCSLIRILITEKTLHWKSSFWGSNWVRGGYRQFDRPF